MVQGRKRNACISVAFPLSFRTWYIYLQFCLMRTALFPLSGVRTPPPSLKYDPFDSQPNAYRRRTIENAERKIDNVIKTIRCRHIVVSGHVTLSVWCSGLSHTQRVELCWYAWHKIWTNGKAQQVIVCFLSWTHASPANTTMAVLLSWFRIKGKNDQVLVQPKATTFSSFYPQYAK